MSRDFNQTGTLIDIKEIWFGSANGQILLSACNTIMAGYYSLMFLFHYANFGLLNRSFFAAPA